MNEKSKKSYSQKNWVGRHEKLTALVEGAMMIALAVAIEMIPLPFKWPNGGSVSIGAVPIIYYSLRRGAKYGLGAGFVFSCVQMILGFYVPPANTFLSIVLCVLLDYVVAFTALGAAGFISVPFEKSSKVGVKLCGYGIAAVVVSLLRFVCSFISGIVLWGSYAPEGTPVWIYSLTYNGGYMVPNAIVAAMLIVLISIPVAPKTLKPIMIKK